MRYFLTEEREVTREEYILAERAAGFHPKGDDPNQIACASFGNGKISGRVEYDHTAKMIASGPDLQNIPRDAAKGVIRDGKWGRGEYHS